MAAYSLHVLFHVVFQNFYAGFKKFVGYINTSTSKILAGELEPAVTYISTTLGYPAVSTPSPL